MTFGGAFGGAWVGGTAQGVTPVVARYYLAFNGTSSYMDCGSDPSLDNLPATDFTVDFWTRVDEPSHYLIHRAPFRDGSGWTIDNVPGDYLAGRLASHWKPMTSIVYSDTQVYTYVHSNHDIPINTWTHVAVAFDLATKRSYVALNGQWCAYEWQDTATGTPVDDAANTLWIGAEHGDAGGDANNHLGGFGWVRISSGHRWTIGANFTPPMLETAPTVDGTTLELWPMNDGSGTVAHASVVSPGNDAILTACVWSAH